MRLLQIAQLGHSILRERASEIEAPHSAGIQDLIKDMLTTLADVNGVGIAAPQVHVGKRAFIVASRPNPRYPDAPDMEPTPVINPEILRTSEEIAKEWEGCLSLPGIRGLVPRPVSIRVKYTTYDNNPVECEYSGFIARIFQHEYDHLEGKVFLDRLESTRDVIMEKEFLKLLSK